MAATTSRPAWPGPAGQQRRTKPFLTELMERAVPKALSELLFFFKNYIAICNKKKYNVPLGETWCEIHVRSKVKFPFKTLCRRRAYRLLPQAPVGFDGAQLRFGVRAQGAPRCLGAGLHDGAGGGAGAADVHGRPDAAHQRVHPGLQPGAHQRCVPFGLVHTGGADGDVQDRVQALEALLHVRVLWRPAVILQGFLWKKQK